MGGAVRICMCYQFSDCQSAIMLELGTADRARCYRSKTKPRCSLCISFVFLFSLSIKRLVFSLQFSANHLHINTVNHQIHCDNCWSLIFSKTHFAPLHMQTFPHMLLLSHLQKISLHVKLPYVPDRMESFLVIFHQIFNFWYWNPNNISRKEETLVYTLCQVVINLRGYP